MRRGRWEKGISVVTILMQLYNWLGGVFGDTCPHGGNIEQLFGCGKQQERKIFQTIIPLEKMEKFCCEKFRFFYSTEKQWGLNIRIVKLGDAFINRGQLNFDRSYFITEGYAGNISDCLKTMTINYCPFCGKELRSMYSHDKFVHEIMDID